MMQAVVRSLWSLKRVLGKYFFTVLPKDNYSRWWFERAKEKPLADTSGFLDQPLISIIMPVYNAHPGVLFKAVRSVFRQSYKHWQLCIADDCSTRASTRLFLKCLRHRKIRIVFLDRNHNIAGASNQAARLAGGEYLALMDNDDEIEADALYQVVNKINQSGADFLYSDEDFIDLNGEYEAPHFKPDYSPDLLFSHNYITHFCVFKKTLFDQAGGFDSDYDGAQDYDLFLKLTEKAQRIGHIPQILYHWRKSETSTSMSFGAKPYTHERGKAALRAAVRRRGIKARVMDANFPNYYRVKRHVRRQELVSIVIPFKDQSHLLSGCLDALLNRTAYQAFEVIGVSNQSVESATHDVMQRYQEQDRRLRFIEHNQPFNFSELVNWGVRESRGGQIVLMNNDIEVINHGWLEAMLEHSQRAEVAAVGAKLYFGHNIIQHAGVGVGLGGAAGHLHLRFARHAYGYFNRLNIIQNVSAVTGALMMVKRRIYSELNGFDEQLFKIAYNDVDFCLRAYKKGYLNVFTPYAQAYHYESLSRGYDDSGEKLARLNHEKSNLWQVHGDMLLKGDPYYNPNFDQGRDDFEIPYKSIV